MVAARIFKFILVGLVAGATVRAYAYPIFYKCDAQERMVGFLPDQEFEDYLIKIYEQAPDKEKFVNDLCGGLEQCIIDFKQMVALASISQTAAKNILDQRLQEVYKIREGIAQISPSDYALREKARMLGRAQNICQEEKSKIPEEIFIKKSGDNSTMHLFYPHYSNYMYITGCRRLGKNDFCRGHDPKLLEESIEDALLMGTDPYVAVAIGLMENGVDGLAQLTLDPIAKMAAMGCSGKHVADDASRTQAGKVLESYGNIHEVASGTIKNDALSDRLKSFVLKKGQKVSNEPSYLCRSVANAAGSFTKEPQDGQCCLRTNFQPVDQQGAAMVSRALTMESIRNMLARPFRNQSDPAFRIQRFNGFSQLMGGAEPVSAFRSGVNYYEHPAYGYQAMDFILNSLISNPLVRNMVERNTKKLSANYKSALCQGQGAGFYHVDSDHYFNKHRDAPRLLSLKEKFEQGIAWEKLTPREQKVLAEEFEQPEVKEKLSPFKDQVNETRGKKSGSWGEVAPVNTDSAFVAKNEFFELLTNAGHTPLDYHKAFWVDKTKQEFLDSIPIPANYKQRELLLKEAAEAFDEQQNLEKIRDELKKINRAYFEEYKNTIAKWEGLGWLTFNFSAMSISSNPGTKTLFHSDISVHPQGQGDAGQMMQPMTADDFAKNYIITDKAPNKQEIYDQLLKLGEMSVETQAKIKKVFEMPGAESLKSASGWGISWGVGGGLGSSLPKYTQFANTYAKEIKGTAPGFQKLATEEEALRHLNISPDHPQYEKFKAAAKKVLEAEANTNPGQYAPIPGLTAQPQGGFSSVSKRRQITPVDYNAAFKEYFQKVYPSRATIGQASDYSWRRFTDNEIKTLRDRLHSPPPPRSSMFGKSKSWK